MGLDRLIVVALALVVVLSACDSDKGTPPQLLYGETAQELTAVPGSAIAIGRVLDAPTLGRRFTSCSPGGAVDGGVIVERIGVFGESLTFGDKAGKTLYSCDGGTDPTRERRPPWCGGSSGRLVHGRLVDPRLDILCRDHEGRPLAYAWVEPVAGARWIGVDQGSYTEVYEVLAGLAVRVATSRGIQLGRSRATFAVTQYDAAGKALVEGPLEAAVAG
ncbi:MAG: hypothetical protein H0W90_00890 [Actinobacteria bacterium]|nr:hypothetical protein [Actinomycetota bacterium]